MGAYNCVNGEPCCGSKTLLKKILREEWGFDGHVVSDCWAIKDFHENHLVTGTPVQSAALAMEASCLGCLPEASMIPFPIRLWSVKNIAIFQNGRQESLLYF